MHHEPEAASRLEDELREQIIPTFEDNGWEHIALDFDPLDLADE